MLKKARDRSLTAAQSGTVGRELQSIRAHAAELRSATDADLRANSVSLAEAFANPRSSWGFRQSTPTHLLAGLGLAVEVLRRSLGIELYDVQLQAALATSQGRVAEMQTGEGKTYAVAPAAIVAALQGQPVHVATPNAYLAERDYHLLRPAFELLDLSSGLLTDHEQPPDQKQAAYDSQITYGTGFGLGFDYLRDQVPSPSGSLQPLGGQLLSQLRGTAQLNRPALQRGHGWALVDEIDNVLLDDAGSPLILCGASPAVAPDAAACLAARKLLAELQAGIHFHAVANGQLQLSQEGLLRIHASSVNIPMLQLRRPWSEYVTQALRAEFTLQRDIHYLIHDAEIRIVDTSTGRIFSDRTWSDGLHQAVEAKEGLSISGEQHVLAQITRQRYFRLYPHLAGMTGTALGCEREFQHVYRLKVTEIPRRLPCRRQLLPLRTFATAHAKWQAIAEETLALHATGRAVLIGTRTIRESRTMAELLNQRGLNCQLLNGLQDAEEAAVVAEAGRVGAITIATNMAGRGTDICLDEAVRQAGGLHVIVSEPNDLARVDRQLIGRCARQGDPGSARSYLSAEDDLLQRHAPGLVRPIRRGVDRRQELPWDLTRRLQRVQRKVERQQAAQRMQLMRRDLSRESLLGRIAGVS